VKEPKREFLDIACEVGNALDLVFGLDADKRETCVTYSRILAEVLTEMGYTARVAAVHCMTANAVARLLLTRKAPRYTPEQWGSLGARYALAGDIKSGQEYQHAVCVLPGDAFDRRKPYDVVIDTTMTARGSGQVHCYPYWMLVAHPKAPRLVAKACEAEWPKWMCEFFLETYELTHKGYDENPEKVAEGKRRVSQVLGLVAYR